MKIRTLFIFWLIFFSISSIIAYAFYCSGTMNSIAEKQYERLYSDIAVNESKNISEYVKNVSSSASIVACDENIRNYAFYNTDEKNEAFESAMNYLSDQTGIIRVVVIEKSTGVVSISASNDANLAYKLFDDNMMSKIEEGEAYISTVLDSNNRESGYEIVSPSILDDRIILVYFSNTYIDGIIKAGSFPTNGRVVLVDSLHHIVDTAYVGTMEEISAKNGYAQYNIICDAINNAALLNLSLIHISEPTRPY